MAASPTNALKAKARRLGFASVGVCRAGRPGTLDAFGRWLDAGFAGRMDYMGRHRAAREHPEQVLAGTRSLMMLALPYRTVEPVEKIEAGRGRVSRYAWGADYHEVIRPRLRRLVALHRELAPEAAARGVVDTAPLLERDFARAAGLGWIGKNTMLLNRRLGSWFFLAALLSTAELEPDVPFEDDHCRGCRACLDACPTGALVAPYQLDARRCVSYLSIESRESIPDELRVAMGNRCFGCDVCQEVCPWNGRVEACHEKVFAPSGVINPLPLLELFSWDEAAFERRFRGTSLWRTGRAGLLRNAAIVLGNGLTSEAEGALRGGLDEEDRSVREACAWALGRIGGTP